MNRLTQTSNKGGTALTFNLDITCDRSQMEMLVVVFNKLKHYEDLEEQGKLVELPCKVGSTVYEVFVDEIPTRQCYMNEYVVEDISTKSIYYADDWINLEDYKDFVFFDIEQAKARLKELES